MSKMERQIKSLAARNKTVWKSVKKAQELQYDVNYQRFYGRHATAKASITEINLEFCSACNLRCQFCALDHTKPKSLMSIAVIDKVFEALVNDERFSRVRKINLHNGGETLLHPERDKLLARIKYHKLIFKTINKPFPTINLLTNGMLLRETLTRQILELRVVDEIGFSLDGGTPEEFERLRVNAKWKKFADNVSNFIRLKNEIDPNVSTFGISIIPKPLALNDSWMHPDFQRIVRMLDSVEYRRLHDWGGQVEIGEMKDVNKKGCMMLLRQMVVLPNGDVSVCCNDLNSEGVVGNVLKQDLYEIYRSQQRRRYVDYLQQGRKQELDLCKNCVSF